MPIDLRALLAGLDEADHSTSSSSSSDDESLLDSSDDGDVPPYAGNDHQVDALHAGSSALSRSTRTVDRERDTATSSDDGSSSSSSSELSSDDSAFSTRTEASGTKLPHRLVRLQTVLFLVLRLILSITSDTDNVARDTHYNGHTFGVIGQSAGGGGASGGAATRGTRSSSKPNPTSTRRHRPSCVYPDLKDPWTRLSAALGDLQKAYMGMWGGSGSGGGSGSSASSGMGVQVAGAVHACEWCYELEIYLLRTRLMALCSDKTYTRRLTKGEARASTAVGKVGSLLPVPPSSSVPIDGVILKRDTQQNGSGTRDLNIPTSGVGAVILLRFAACALQVHRSHDTHADLFANSTGMGGWRAVARVRYGHGRCRDGTLDLSYLAPRVHGARGTVKRTKDQDSLDASGQKQRLARGSVGHALAQLQWAEMASVVGMDVNHVHTLNLRGNELYDDDLDRIALPTSAFPNFQTVDVSHQPLTSIPLSWLTGNNASNTMSRCTGGKEEVRGIKFKVRKTACTSPDATEQGKRNVFLGRVGYTDLCSAVRASTRCVTAAAAATADVRGRAMGARSLLDICTLIAARQYIILHEEPSRGAASSRDGCPVRCRHRQTHNHNHDLGHAKLNPQPPASSGSDDDEADVSIDTDTDEHGDDNPYGALPLHLYDRIISVYMCDLCSRLAFPTAPSVVSNNATRRCGKAERRQQGGHGGGSGYAKRGGRLPAGVVSGERYGNDPQSVWDPPSSRSDHASATGRDGWAGEVEFAYPANTLPHRKLQQSRTGGTDTNNQQPRHQNIQQPRGTGTRYDLDAATTARSLANRPRTPGNAEASGRGGGGAMLSGQGTGMGMGWEEGDVMVRGRVCVGCLGLLYAGELW